jgi:hypothetical protein
MLMLALCAKFEVPDPALMTNKRATLKAGAAGAAATSLGILDHLSLLPSSVGTWVTIGLLVTYATCIAADRLIATCLRACDLAERIRGLYAEVHDPANDGSGP